MNINDQLKLQELIFFYKYRHDNVPVYLLNWNIIPNYNIHSHDTRKATNIQTSMTIINDTPELVLETIVTHSLRGFAYYLKMYLLQKYQNVCTISDCYICQFNTQSR